MRDLESRVSRLEKRLLKRAASEEVSFCLLYRGGLPSKAQFGGLVGTGPEGFGIIDYFIKKYGGNECLDVLSLSEFRKYTSKEPPTAPKGTGWWSAGTVYTRIVESESGFILVAEEGRDFTRYAFFLQEGETRRDKFRGISKKVRGKYDDIALDAMWYLFFGDRDKYSNSFIGLKGDEDELWIELNQYFFDREVPIVQAIDSYDVSYIEEVLDEASGIVKEFYEKRDAEREAEEDFEPYAFDPDFDEDDDY